MRADSAVLKGAKEMWNTMFVTAGLFFFSFYTIQIQTWSNLNRQSNTT